MRSFSLTVDVPDEDFQRLRISVGDDADLNRIITAVMTAGANEFLNQATGRVVPGGIREARLYRVFLLLQAGVTLKEAQSLVAAIFKETPGRARALVESAIARYDVELRSAVDERVAELLEAATWRVDRWEVELPVGFVRDRVLEIAAETTFADPTRTRGALYQFPDETYQAVRERLGLAPRPKPKK